MIWLRLFITGPMIPPKNWARIWLCLRSWFSMPNSSLAVSSWQNTLTTFCPVMVSSIYPFTAPRDVCWAVKYFWLHPATAPPAFIIMGIITRVTRVRIRLVYTMRNRVPIMLNAPENSCTSVELSICPMVSTSFVKRLIKSPLELVS